MLMRLYDHSVQLSFSLVLSHQLDHHYALRVLKNQRFRTCHTLIQINIMLFKIFKKVADNHRRKKKIKKGTGLRYLERDHRVLSSGSHKKF